MNNQLDIFESQKGRDAGAAAALGHANSVISNWDERAFRKLIEYMERHPGEKFMCEDVRWFAHLDLSFPMAPNQRAWGDVIRRAAKSGLIKSMGTAKVKNVKAHRANAAVWIKK